ncbi:MAG: hypothetical protein RIT81_00465 [Deltaproteobacteria bacterium]
MKKLLLLVSLLFPAAALADDDTTLSRLLLAHHDAPTRAQIERHVEAPKPRLVAIALDARMFPPLRKRAIAVLAAWPDAEVEATYRTLLARRDEHVMHHVTFAVARAFPEEAPDILTPLMLQTDHELLLSAVDALVRVDTAEARAQLDAVMDPSLSATIRAARRRAEKIRRR